MVEVLPGEGGGPVGSPGDVVIVFQHQGEQLLGGTQMQRVVEVGCLTVPSQVFFQFRLPATGYTRAAGAAYAQGFALMIEDLLTLPYVAGISYRQDLNSAGQLLDQLDVFWQLEDGSADGDVVVSLPASTDDSVMAALQAAMAPYQVGA
jgi:hypothetical protein